jgi:hypothetical protein
MMQFSLQSLLLAFVVVAAALGAFGPGGILIAAILLGIAAYIRSARSMGRAARYGVLWLLWFVLVFILILPAFQSAREAARKGACLNNLKQLGLAIHNYNDVNGHFPPAYTTDANGKPLHSWRTLLLPFMEYGRLDEKIDFTTPWDAPSNTKLYVQLYELLCPSANDG